ncbi:MAG TPA: FecR domain-containing protein [Caulobacteraceae bacterium]|nr:FecR domain-containing protein [Caulobacteraceae bacterium]
MTSLASFESAQRRNRPRRRWLGFMAAAVILAPAAALAEAAIGQIKTETGTVTIERGGKSRPAAIGDRVYPADTLITAARSSVGVTFSDNSLMALGPFSRLSLDEFRFNAVTHAGNFDVTLHRGALAVKSGQIVRQTPEAMRVRTPAALLGVRGTEFVVRADGA